ncbi:hypothetical protein BDV93DRAFT_486410 [Ceratobasidium sp. AG-I]|nr:hypothetical protein BDV93DRAFT_486410 [Ceratobasidium sp. AG-I]
MAPITKLTAVGLMIASGAVAAPWETASRHITHRVRTVGPNKNQFQSYHPPSVFEAFGTGVEHPLTKRGIKYSSSVEAATAFLESKLGVSADAISHKTGSGSDVAGHEYFRQMINGIPVANAVANVALRNNKVVSYGASFVKPESVASSNPTLTKEQAVAKAEASTGGKYNGWPTSVEYFAKDSDHVVLTHVVQVQNAQSGEWYQVFVDTSSGDVVNVVSFVADASYRVVSRTPQQNVPTGFVVVTNPADTVASPNGWHQYGNTTTTTTSGNNIFSSKSSGGLTSQSTPVNNYLYEYNLGASPSTAPNPDAGNVNAFYVANRVHDLVYRYGFNEPSYNFQMNNNGKGGAQNDPVRITVQDVSGTNDASFATPPDGQSGQMRLFVWTYTTPKRDGAIENDLITHEYAHGISNRLTGGGTARCLQTTEASGMGEGWSDAFAEWTEQESLADALADFTMGSYVSNTPGGIRSYPYSTSMTTNPLTYASIATRNEVHAIGEIWALFWHEIYAALITKLGFSTIKNDPTGTAGNIVALHLYIDGMKLQPCNPTFISARDAIIQADVNRYGGANKCTLWTAFAKRGLGYGATTVKTDVTALPSGC